LARWLVEKGYDAVHTLDLPDKNRTTDRQISELSVREQRIVISKDADFYNRFLLKLEPFKLIFLTVGNVSTEELISLFDKNLDRIFGEMEFNNVIEITPASLITID